MLQGVSTLAAFTVVYVLTQDLNIAIVAMLVAAIGVLVLFDIPHCPSIYARDSKLVC